MGQIVIAEFADNENDIFEQTIQWLSEKLCSAPVLLKSPTKGMVLNPFSRTAIDKEGNNIYLTAKEFDLLYFLFSHKGQVFTKEQIYENVWGYDNAPDASNLSSFIRKLRLKIEPHPDNPRYIITVWGVGYKFSGEEKP